MLLEVSIGGGVGGVCCAFDVCVCFIANGVVGPLPGKAGHFVAVFEGCRDGFPDGGAVTGQGHGAVRCHDWGHCRAKGNGCAVVFVCDVDGHRDAVSSTRRVGGSYHHRVAWPWSRSPAQPSLSAVRCSCLSRRSLRPHHSRVYSSRSPFVSGRTGAPMLCSAFVFSATDRLVSSDWSPAVLGSWSGNFGAAVLQDRLPAHQHVTFATETPSMFAFWGQSATSSMSPSLSLVSVGIDPQLCCPCTSLSPPVRMASIVSTRRVGSRSGVLYRQRVNRSVSPRCIRHSCSVKSSLWLCIMFVSIGQCDVAPVPLPGRDGDSTVLVAQRCYTVRPTCGSLCDSITSHRHLRRIQLR